MRLKPISITNEEIQSLPISFRVTQSDLLYINEELSRIETNEILKIDYSSIKFNIGFDDGDDTQSGSTTDSIPQVRSCFETNTFDKKFFVEEWFNRKYPHFSLNRLCFLYV